MSINKIEQSYKASNGVTIKYYHKPSKYDFHHAIFVFSGFLNHNPGNYDFTNALQDCPCDIFWIGDDFEEMYTYYLCINMDFKIEDAVIEFIHIKMQELRMEKDQVTVTGFSKGGSAALYYGLKLGIRNIICTVPQIYIGNYIDNDWKHVAEHMMGKSYTSANIQYLNNLIIKLLRSDTKLDRNIYLLTSETDIQYPTEIAPFLNDFLKYSNFNLLKTYSLFVRGHNQVTGHHVALLLSIYYALANNAIPRYNQGKVEFFSKPLFANHTPSGEPVIDMRMAKIADNRLFIEGVALLRGYNIAEYSEVDYLLHLKNNKSSLQFNLAKAHRPNLTKEFFDGKSLVIYDKAWFTTYQYNGIDISNIAKGKYQISLEIKLANGITITRNLEDKRNIIESDVIGNYQLGIENNILHLTVS